METSFIPLSVIIVVLIIVVLSASLSQVNHKARNRILYVTHQRDIFFNMSKYSDNVSFIHHIFTRYFSTRKSALTRYWN